MDRKKIRNTLLFVLFFMSLGLANAYWNKSKVLSDPAFTVATLTGEVGGTKGATYIKYEYLVNKMKYTGSQGVTFVPKKTKIRPVKGKKYLLVYNIKNPTRTYLINLELDEDLGVDLSDKYSIDSLENVGLVSILGF